MTGVPSNIIIPFVGVEFDSSRAQVGAGEMPVNLLVIGQMTTGTGMAETLTLCTTAAEVGEKFGLGSQIHRMAIQVFANNTTVPVWFIALADATGTQATHEFTITGPATEAGKEFVGYVAGKRFAVAVANGDTATEIGDAWIAAVNLDRVLAGKPPVMPPTSTMLGGLYRYLREANPDHFQPMNSNWGLVDPLPTKIRDKRKKREALAERAQRDFQEWLLAEGIAS